MHFVKKKIHVRQDSFLVRYVILKVFISHMLEAPWCVAMATIEVETKGKGVKDREDEGEMTDMEDIKSMVEV